MDDDDPMEIYRRAVFEFDGPDGRVRITLDAANPILDALLTPRLASAFSTRRRPSTWAFITAREPAMLDPGELALTDEENDRAEQLLERQVRSGGHPMWRGDGASLDRTHVEASLLIGAIDLESARALGRAFRQRAIIVGAVGGHAQLVDLRSADDAAPPAGVPIPHSSGRQLFVQELHLDDIFAGYLEGGPNGEELREHLLRAAADAGGLPVHFRLPPFLPVEADRKTVITTSPRVLCMARMERAGEPAEEPPKRWTVAWLSDSAGDSSIEQLLTVGLEDVRLSPDEASAGQVAPELVLNIPKTPYGRPAPFSDMKLRTADGCDVHLDDLHLGFAPGAVEGQGNISSDEQRRATAHFRGPLVVVDGSGSVGPARAGLMIPSGSAAIRLSLVADPVRHAVDDGDAYWRSRITLVTVLEPGTRPLRQVLETLVALVPWRTLAEDADEMP
ncbi:MAG: DUF3293 domain-containing protein [Deltaproteobacteria bacterium]|nr:DUF3293 domain-containing protein [Deltaproteobacteria bacterium]